MNCEILPSGPSGAMSGWPSARQAATGSTEARAPARTPARIGMPKNALAQAATNAVAARRPQRNHEVGTSTTDIWLVAASERKMRAIDPNAETRVRQRSASPSRLATSVMSTPGHTDHDVTER